MQTAEIAATCHSYIKSWYNVKHKLSNQWFDVFVDFFFKSVVDRTEQASWVFPCLWSYSDAIN